MNQGRGLTVILKLLLKILPQQRHQRSQGFSLIDVLAGIVVLSAFISLSMNALLTSALLKNRARIVTEANNWIEQDLELVKNQAAIVTYALASNASAGTNQITLVNNYGLASGEQISIAGDSTIYTIQSVSGNVINLTDPLYFAANQGSVVSPISKCKATASGLGLATALRASLPAVTNSGTRRFSNKTFTLSRTTTVGTNAPFQVLNVAYTVAQSGASTPVARMYTEVIPTAAFQCPSA